MLKKGLKASGTLSSNDVNFFSFQTEFCISDKNWP